VETYRISVWDNAEFSLKILEAYAAMRPIVLENKNNNKIIECCYQIDSDKFLYVQFFVDGLTDYHEGEPFSEWKDNEIPKFIIDQQKLVLNRIRKDIPQIKDVTWLILVQGYGRPFHFNLNTSLIQCLTIALSVSELEVIAYSERGDRLALWKYLKHKEQQKQYRPILSMSELDEFELYRSHKHSYPLPDDIKGGIRVKPGIGGDLVRKVYSELDLHALAGYKPNSIIEVISSRNKKFAASVPSQFTHTIDRAAIVIEQFELPVWVTGPKYTKQSEVELHPLYGILVDAIGYWLFRSKDFTTKLLSGLKDKMDSLWIEISLQPSRTWRHVPVDLQESDSNQNIHEYISVKIHEEGNKIKLIFKESIKAWLVGSDNRIERELMYLVFQAIRDFKKDKVGDFAQLQSNEEIREAINLYIPNGIRTMILIMPLLDPRYDNRSLPEVRLAQESDEVDVSKAIRTYLISKSLNNCHPNTKDEKIKFIHDIVDHLYTEEARMKVLRAGIDPAQIAELENTRKMLDFWEHQIKLMAWNTENEDGTMFRSADGPHNEALKFVGLNDPEQSKSAGFPTSKRQLLDKLHVRLSVFDDRVEVKSQFPVEPVGVQPCTSTKGN